MGSKKHHGTSTAGMRPTYLNLGEVEHKLGHKAGTIEGFIKKDRKGKFI